MAERGVDVRKQLLAYWKDLEVIDKVTVIFVLLAGAPIALVLTVAPWVWLFQLARAMLS